MKMCSPVKFIIAQHTSYSSTGYVNVQVSTYTYKFLNSETIDLCGSCTWLSYFRRVGRQILGWWLVCGVLYIGSIPFRYDRAAPFWGLGAGDLQFYGIFLTVTLGWTFMLLLNIVGPAPFRRSVEETIALLQIV